MTNKEIAALIKEIARYLELSGENPFKVRAFNGAARAIESNTGSIGKIALEGSLREIRGIGRGVEDVVLELLQTGQSSLLRELKDPFPDTIGELFTLSHRKNNIQKELFLSIADGGELLSFGPTRVTIHRDGMQVDFRIVDKGSYPCALQHFTGSKEQNTILRARAKRMGFKLNEYGLHRG
jgi:DNA polymerase/3'-5' exonuclease PolX